MPETIEPTPAGTRNPVVARADGGGLRGQLAEAMRVAFRQWIGSDDEACNSHEAGEHFALAAWPVIGPLLADRDDELERIAAALASFSEDYRTGDGVAADAVRFVRHMSNLNEDFRRILASKSEALAEEADSAVSLRREVERLRSALDQARDERDDVLATVERLRGELVEARRVLTALPHPSSIEELREKITEIFGDPNEATVHAFLDFAWSETARIAGKEMAARWQAEDELAGVRAAIERLTAERVRAEHFACRPYRCGDEASGLDGKERCHGCRRVWPCPTLAALDPASGTDNPRRALLRELTQEAIEAGSYGEPAPEMRGTDNPQGDA